MVANSQEYIDYELAGPFAGRMDPWAEVGLYFKQLHSSFIGHLMQQIQRPLRALGYRASRERTIQVIEGREPDLSVYRTTPNPSPESAYFRISNYMDAAEAVLADPGIEVDDTEWEAIHIRDEQFHLVTVVELISPNNKRKPSEIAAYQAYRQQLLSQQINVVEIDLTRSVKRLLQTKLTHATPYHVAVFLPFDLPLVVDLPFGEPLKRCALPLRQSVVPVELQAAYDHAYQENALAIAIHAETGYHERALPFRRSLTEVQRQALRQQIAAWQQQLDKLQKQPLNLPDSK